MILTCRSQPMPRSEAVRRHLAWLLQRFGYGLMRLLPDTRPANLAVSQALYMWQNRRLANIAMPRHYSEHLMRFKLSADARAPEIARVTDKEALKSYVRERIGPGHTVETLALLDDQRAVDGFRFPLPSVVKPAHSYSDVMFLRDRQPGRFERRMLKFWLGKNFFYLGREPNYKTLKPRLIVERMLETAGSPPEDVKVFCFAGEPRFLQVDWQRYQGHRRDLYDMDGRRLALAFRRPNAGRPFPFADRLDEIATIARALSAPFPFVRVDLYVLETAILVGELTFYPTNCSQLFRPVEADLEIARLFETPAAPLALPAGPVG